MLLSVFTSCQGSVPTNSTPNTKVDTMEKTNDKTLPLTKETNEKETTEQKETSDQPVTQEEEMTLDEAVNLLKRKFFDINGIDKKYEDAIYCVSKYIRKDGFEEGIIHIEYRPEVRGVDDRIYEYFSLVHNWIAEQKKLDPDFTFELPEDSKISYFNGAFVCSGILWSYSDYGTEKVFDISDNEIRVYLELIMEKAFWGNEVLEKIYSSDSPYICKNAFNNCPSLKTVDLSGDQTYTETYNRINYVPANYCFGQEEDHFVVSEGTVDEDFRKMQEKYDATFGNVNVVDNDPDHFIVIDGVLMAYLGIGGHIEIPEGVTRISGDVFNHCTREVLSIKLPSTLKVIDTWNFVGLINLIELEIPEGVERINSFAFTTGNNDDDMVAEKPFIKITNIPEDCKVSENAFGDNELQKEAADYYNPNIKYVKSR